MIRSFGATDPGRRRPLNEDSLLADADTGLFMVADGIGGHNAGEVASRLAVEVVSTFVRRSGGSDEISWPYGVDPKLSRNANRLRTAVRLANESIRSKALSRTDRAGMGTTVVAALVQGQVITLCSAGDSRCYRLRNAELQQMTTDDSWVQAAFHEGLLNSEQAEKHPLKNVITKSLGSEEDFEPALQEQVLETGDLYLLCSDGLHGMVSDSRMQELLVGASSLEGAVKALIEEANDSGGKDNVTAVLLQYQRV